MNQDSSHFSHVVITDEKLLCIQSTESVYLISRTASCRQTSVYERLWYPRKIEKKLKRVIYY